MSVSEKSGNIGENLLLLQKAISYKQEEEEEEILS